MSTRVSAPRLAYAPSQEMGRRVHARRRALGFRFGKDLADALRWNASVVSRLENGQRGVYERDLEGLCRYLQVLPAWFGGDEGAAEPLEPSEPGRAPGPERVVRGLVDELIRLRREELAALERAAELLRQEGYAEG